MPQSCGLASLVHNMRGLPSNLFSFALKCTISIVHIQCLVMDLGHFTIVGRILFAPFRLYSDKVLQATCSCTCGHVDSSFFCHIEFLWSFTYSPNPPSYLLHLLQALALTVATVIQRLWNYLRQKHNNNQWSLMLAKLFESWQQWFRII